MRKASILRSCYGWQGSMPHTARLTPVFYLLLVEPEAVVSLEFVFFEGDSDLVAFVFVLAGAALFVVDLEGAEAFAGVDTLDLLTDSFPFAACGLETGFSERAAVLFERDGVLSERVAVLFDLLTGAGADLAVFPSPVELVPDLAE